MGIEGPGIFLSFDDGWIKEWYECLPLFEEHEIKAIFYLSFGVIGGMANVKFRPNLDEWAMLKEIATKGHMIGYHTWEHMFTKNLFKSMSCDNYRRREIEPGMKLLAKYGFKPKHFAYPYGWESCNDATHRYLLTMFDTLRVEVKCEDWEIYEPESVKKQRIFNSIDVAREKEQMLFSYFDAIVKKKAIAFIHGHNSMSIKAALIDIFGYARELEIPFYSMELLNRVEESD